MLELLAAGWGIKKASIHPMPSLYGKAWLVYAEQGKKYVLKEQFGHLLKAEHAVLFCLDAQKCPLLCRWPLQAGAIMRPLKNVSIVSTRFSPVMW